MLQDKLALVTGAGTGIGKSIALRFAAEGAAVALVGRNKDRIDQTAAAVRESGGKAFAFACDLSDESQVRILSQTVAETAGAIDILVNNAGASKELPFAEMPFSVWEDMIKANLYTAVHITKAVIPGMIQRKSGIVINIASGAGLRGLPGSTAYSAAKAALIAFGQALGDELRPYGVRVNTICPGPVDTEMLQKSSVREFLLKSGVKLSSPEEIASAALFLATQLSGNMNSQVIVMRDGNRW